MHKKHMETQQGELAKMRSATGADWLTKAITESQMLVGLSSCHHSCCCCSSKSKALMSAYANMQSLHVAVGPGACPVAQLPNLSVLRSSGTTHDSSFSHMHSAMFWSLCSEQHPRLRSRLPHRLSSPRLKHVRSSNWTTTHIATTASHVHLNEVFVLARLVSSAIAFGSSQP